MKIKSVIFDFDDCLTDFTSTRYLIARYLDNYCRKHYHIKNFGEVFDSIDTETTIKTRTKKSIRLDNRADWAKLAAKRMGVKLTDKQAQTIRKIYWRLAKDKVRLLPNAVDVLKNLSKCYDLYVLSDADGETAKEKIDRIKKVNIYKYFKGNVFGDAIKTTKPDKKFYTYLIKKYNVNPKESIMIGDKPQYDLLPAKQVGMKTVWIKHGIWADTYKNKKFKYVDWEIKDLRELLRIIKCQK
jgi:HAD superfamily hydrolase (TIGR01509 family)